MKRFLCFVLTALTAIFCGCSKDEEKVRNQYEKPVRTMVLSISEKDNSSLLRCYASPIADDYKSDENSDEKLAETLYDSVYETVGESFFLGVTVEGKTEIEGEELEELCKEVKNGIKIKMAYRLEVKLSATVADKSYSCQIELVVGKIGSSWYICSPVIEKLDLTADK